MRQGLCAVGCVASTCEGCRVNVKEVMDILKECDPDQNLYILDLDGTAQIVTAMGDLQHIMAPTDLGLGIKIPDDLYLMTTAQFQKFIAERDEDDDE